MGTRNTKYLLFHSHYTLIQISIFVWSILLSNLAYSQSSIFNSRTDNLLSKARQYEVEKKYEKAENYYLKALKNSGTQLEVIQAVGSFYMDRKEYEKAVDVYKKKSSPAMSFTLAKNLALAMQYKHAQTVLSNWKIPQNITKEQQNEYDRLKRNIQFGSASQYKKHDIVPENLAFRINTKYTEYFPSISPDDSTLIFTRRVGGMDDDFFIAKRDSCGGWFIARDMGMPPNSTKQEVAHYISADRNYLFLMRCGNTSVNGWTMGGCDLYFAYRKGNGWSEAVPFGATINTPSFEGMPSLSSDNKELYFVSDREGGYGGLDIWVTKYIDGYWQIPENLGPEINTPFNETAPFIAADNRTLYFASDGHSGFGGIDLFVSNRKNNRWQRPENLGYPINTVYDDVSICVAANGQKAYFSSDRPGGLGGMDIYETPLPEKLQPTPVTYLYGIVKDSLDGNALQYAQMEWKDAATNELLMHYQSNPGDASFVSAIELNRKMILNVYRSGYLDFTDTLLFTEAHTIIPDTYNVALLYQGYEPPKHDSLLLIVNFHKNILELNDSIKKAIANTLAPFANVESAEFLINGYTDDIGTPYINEDFSYTRSRNVAKILVGLGIEPHLIKTRGWADVNPIAPNDTEENRYKNRRVEIVIRKP